MNSSDTPSGQNSDPSSASSDRPLESSGASTVHETVEKARRMASSTATDAKNRVAEMAGEGKNAAADKVSGYSDRLREAARSAEESDDPNIAHFAGQAADRLQGLADYMREADFERLRDDAAQVARRHPALFLGGMLVAGLVLGNLAKASVQTLRDDTGDDEVEGDPRNDREEGGTNDAGTVVGVTAGGYSSNLQP